MISGQTCTTEGHGLVEALAAAENLQIFRQQRFTAGDKMIYAVSKIDIQ